MGGDAWCGRRKDEENAAEEETPCCKGDALLFMATGFSVFLMTMPVATVFKEALSQR